MDYTPVNAKLKKQLKKVLAAYGITELPEYAYFVTPKQDLYVVTQELADFPLEQLKLNTIGIYVGEWKEDSFRMSIEGSQLFGPLATENVLAVDEKVKKMWMYGLDLPCKEVFEGYVIVSCGDDYLGSGPYKEGKILNHVPKGRRIHE